jgi:hypothetical protein
MRGTRLTLSLCLVAITGCGSTERPATTIESAVPASGAPEAHPATTSAPAPSASYPVVRFSVTTQSPSGSWPFTAQLIAISTNPSGFAGSTPVSPQLTYLTVQVALTSLTTDRPVQPPGVSVRCHAPGDSSWKLNDTQEGYDEGSEPPSATGYNVPMNDGQPHAWDVEWQVPAGTSTTDVKCVLLPENGTLKLN